MTPAGRTGGARRAKVLSDAYAFKNSLDEETLVALYRHTLR